MVDPEIAKKKDNLISKLEYENEVLKIDFQKLEQKMKKVQYFCDIPDIENSENTDGYKVAYHLDLLDSAFVKTLKVLNYFKSGQIDNFERK